MGVINFYLTIPTLTLIPEHRNLSTTCYSAGIDRLPPSRGDILWTLSRRRQLYNANSSSLLLPLSTGIKLNDSYQTNANDLVVVVTRLSGGMRERLYGTVDLDERSLRPEVSGGEGARADGTA